MIEQRFRRDIVTAANCVAMASVVGAVALSTILGLAVYWHLQALEAVQVVREIREDIRTLQRLSE